MSAHGQRVCRYLRGLQRRRHWNQDVGSRRGHRAGPDRPGAPSEAAEVWVLIYQRDIRVSYVVVMPATNWEAFKNVARICDMDVTTVQWGSRRVRFKYSTVIQSFYSSYARVLFLPNCSGEA